FRSGTAVLAAAYDQGDHALRLLIPRTVTATDCRRLHAGGFFLVLLPIEGRVRMQYQGATPLQGPPCRRSLTWHAGLSPVAGKTGSHVRRPMSVTRCGAMPADG